MRKKISATNSRSYLKPIIFLMLLLPVMAIIAKEKRKSKDTISYVDTSLDGSQKYVLRVDGKPFYMTNVQVRFDKLRYRWGWDISICEELLKRTSALEFNTLSIPIHWVEVEPEKDKFDWSTLDLYLGMAQKFHFKVELLWFGQNSGGHVQWLKPDRLRTPDYVMYSPKAGNFQSFSTTGSSKETTSEFVIRRDISDYTHDLTDKKLRNREAYVIGKMMEHIAQWDTEQGSAHTVIGIQLNNEVRSFPSNIIIEYMNELGRAVKESPYSVWTRMNCTFPDLYSVLYCNEQLRSANGTYIDFVGIDSYCSSPDKMDEYTESMRTCIPYMGKNYRMIMEAGAEKTNIAQMQVAALSGNTAFNYYELCGPDGRGIFIKDKEKHFVPRSPYTEDDVKSVNRMLNNAMTDIALNASGYGLFVHNWKGNSLMPTIGVENISFVPNYINSQAISVLRNGNEIVLSTSKGGTFFWPDTLKIISASKGYFDSNNKWKDKGTVELQTNPRKHVTSLKINAMQTIRLIRNKQKQPDIILQAEHASYGDGVRVEADIEQCLGFSGEGYLNFPLAGGYAEWRGVNGLKGGKQTIRLRYANGDNHTCSARIIINGVIKQVQLPPTGSWNKYSLTEISTELKPGTENVIYLKSTWTGAGHIDELQIIR